MHDKCDYYFTMESQTILKITNLHFQPLTEKCQSLHVSHFFKAPKSLLLVLPSPTHDWP
jgi:hypothetical protein